MLVLVSPAQSITALRESGESLLSPLNILRAGIWFRRRLLNQTRNLWVMKAKSYLQRLEVPADLPAKWLTTSQVAKRLGCSTRTVCKWVDSGRLLGIRLPGSKDRRVHPQALLEFEEATGYNKARGIGNYLGR